MQSPHPQPAPAKVLVVDDDPLVTVIVRRAMEGVDCQLHSAGDAQGGLDAIKQFSPDLVVLDNILPDASGVDVLQQIHRLAPALPVIFVTACGTGSTAIEAMKLSAFDYLSKPLDPQMLRGQLRRALAYRSLAEADPSEALTTSVVPEPLSNSLVGECPAMQMVFKSVGLVAGQNVTVFIQGEHGTGKESIAREIHKHSRYSDGPVLKLQCLGVSEGRLIEQDLFGHGSNAGLLEEAEGGTLLIKGISHLPLSAQSKLLQVLRDGVFRRLGETAQRKLGCRIVAISIGPLDTRVRRGEFRSDLYYALGSFVISLPPLRKRRGDIPLLAAHILEKLRPIHESFGVSKPRVSAEAMQALSEHLWPGNIDELEAILKRTLVEQKGHVLLAADLRKALGVTAAAITEQSDTKRFATDWTSFTRLRIEAGTDMLHADATEEMERNLFSRVLLHTEGNQAQAARILGITRASLRKRLRQYNMSARQPNSSP